ncbi:phage major tail tube protein [Palleronia sp.]|uniref:phage major tail tube protein n=1 Tax=Palleronia sp. TaxID=1940284 RepID=UPI0035C79F36
MANAPAFVLKNVTVVMAGVNQIGQMAQLTLPAPEATTEEFRNAGMIKPRLVRMGFEAQTFSVELSSFDPAILELMGNGPHNLIARGYAESEDGTQHSYKCLMVAEALSVNPGDHAPASKSSVGTEFTVHEQTLILETEGQEREVWHMSDTEVRIGGVTQNRGMARALGLV